MTSLYERLGGDVALQAAVAGFYEKVMADMALSPFFEGVSIDVQTKKMIGFMRMAMGGPHDYTGKDLRTAHIRLVRDGLGDHHFDAIVDHLEATLYELGIEEGLIAQVLELVASTHGDVLCLEPA
ncbi:MAG: group 1 truncated hemoglobin [Myxococcales bacterium]|nr:group 1 truncated hemoglobin [Myxococcales bacterium]